MLPSYSAERTPFEVLDNYFPGHLREIGLTEEYTMLSFIMTRALLKWLKLSKEDYFLGPLDKVISTNDPLYFFLPQILSTYLKNNEMKITSAKTDFFTQERINAFRSSIYEE